MWVHNWKFKKKIHFRIAVFAMSQPTNLKYLLWGHYFCNLPTKSKSCRDDPVILQHTFMLESAQVLLILTVTSLDNFAIIKTQLFVPKNETFPISMGLKTIMLQPVAIGLLDL